MLHQRYAGQVADLLIPREAWHPFPTAEERVPWSELPQSVQQAHVRRGEEYAGYDWPTCLATRFLDYARDGNRSRYEAVSRGRRGALADLAIAECVEGQGRFVDDIVNGTWAICEESFWGVPAHIGVQKAGTGLPDITEPIVDLFAAETSALLCWVAYLHGPQLDAVSPLIMPRVEQEVQRRILTPLLERDDFGWMGLQGQTVNNWNPWICSNWLTSALLLERDDDRRIQAVEKAMLTVDSFIDPYPSDGGCDEGPSYWGRAGASLYDCLELLHCATGGKVDVYDEPLVQEIGKFIYRVQIANTYFVNFADAPAMLTPTPAVVYAYGERIGDASMMALGAWAAEQSETATKGASDSIGRMLPALSMCDEILEADATPPLPRDVWLDAIEVMVARDSEGASEGLFVAAKGGHNAESHNHNDVGSFVVYADGKPIIIDAGVEAYTRKTFSPQRYDLWTMQSGHHSLPTINGVEQSPGGEYAARDASHSADDAAAELRLDIAPAYPEEAEVSSWVRTVRLQRGEAVVVTDEYELQEATGEVSLSLLTPCGVEVGDDGSIALGAVELADGRESGSATLWYDAEKLSASTDGIALADGRLRRIWGERLTRIILTAKQNVLQDTWELRIASG